MQTRSITGVDFENSLVSKQWVKSEIRPKMVWNVTGKNVFDKMKNVDYDVNKFNLSEKSVINKSDFVYVSNTTLRFEVKKYTKDKLKKWTMYSEPFFKVSNDKDVNSVDVNVYNKFVDEFVTKRKDIIDKVLNSIGDGVLGIRCVDCFIPQHKLEFSMTVRKGWKGYKRITVMFRIKE
jgi:hypothetical protein